MTGSVVIYFIKKKKNVYFPKVLAGGRAVYQFIGLFFFIIVQEIGFKLVVL